MRTPLLCLASCLVGCGQPPLEQLGDSPELHAGWGATQQTTSTGALIWVHRVVITDMPQAAAEDWASSATAFTERGLALHLDGASADARRDSFSVVVQGDCGRWYSRPGIVPTDTFSGPVPQEAHAGVYAWSGGKAAVKACARSGTLRVDFDPATGTDITLTAEFDDGTRWADRRFHLGPPR